MCTGITAPARTTRSDWRLRCEMACAEFGHGRCHAQVSSLCNIQNSSHVPKLTSRGIQPNKHASSQSSSLRPVLAKEHPRSNYRSLIWTAPLPTEIEQILRARRVMRLSMGSEQTHREQLACEPSSRMSTIAPSKPYGTTLHVCVRSEPVPTISITNPAQWCPSTVWEPDRCFKRPWPLLLRQQSVQPHSCFSNARVPRLR